ncbi:MAG: hypothetical protein MK105_02300 [Crocinitomicaceae bacterium]|nr:hypothetical protein [Crocinitomicaceae bacterium]
MHLFAVDPLSYNFPFNSPYAFSENRLIDAVELEGLETVTVETVMKNEKAVAKFEKVGQDRMQKLNRTNFQMVQGTGQIMIADINEGVSGIVYRVGYRTPGGAEFTVDYVITEIEQKNINGQTVEVFDIGDPNSIISSSECGDYYSNCHGVTIGTGGLLRGNGPMKGIVDAEYTPLEINSPSELQIGDLLFEGDHSIVVSGFDPEGNPLFDSNFLGSEGITNASWDEVNSTLESTGILYEPYIDEEGNTMMKERPIEDFNWNRPKPESSSSTSSSDSSSNN